MYNERFTTLEPFYGAYFYSIMPMIFCAYDLLFKYIDEKASYVCTRNLKEIQESEQKAHSEYKILRKYLEEHDLETGVKAANEAEAACQQRITAAEAEIAQLKAELEASERFPY